MMKLALAFAASLLVAPAFAAGVEPGAVAPDFTLNDLDGKPFHLADFKGKTVVLEWFNPECPYVRASHGKGSLVGLAKKEEKAGIVWLAVNSSAAGKEGNGVDKNRAAKKEWMLDHPILLDEHGDVGHAYGALRTPHLFVIGKDGRIAYMGAVDNSPDGEGGSPEGGTLVNYVDQTLADLAASRPVKVSSTKPYGCRVKY